MLVRACFNPLPVAFPALSVNAESTDGVDGELTSSQAGEYAAIAVVPRLIIRAPLGKPFMAEVARRVQVGVREKTPCLIRRKLHSFPALVEHRRLASCRAHSQNQNRAE
jgi:hypothetical protein